MKKIGVLALLMTGILRLVSAQTISISGTVKTRDGDAMYLAFVQDQQHKNGAYTDSLGAFTLVVYPNAQLHVRCFGFRDTLIQIDGRVTFSIVLTPKVNITASRVRKTDDKNSDDINMATLRDQIQNDDAQVSIQVARDYRGMQGPVVTQDPNPNDPNSAKNIAAAEAAGEVSGQYPNGLGPRKTPLPAIQVGPDMAQGAIFPVFHHKDETQGSRFLFENWVHGYVVNASDSLIQNPGIYFNYDKIGGNLLVSRDRHAAIEIDKESVKSFTLFDPLSQPYNFTMVPQIDKTHFVQVITCGVNYCIYKSIKTKFVTADYVSDGVVATGNNYDSFQDEGTYYVLTVKTHQFQQISLKKKAIKQVFASQVDKLNKFMADNSGDIDDSYLASLVDYLNK